jgi:hypothetical protein
MNRRLLYSKMKELSLISNKNGKAKETGEKNDGG